jgi:hypothetical protein
LLGVSLFLNNFSIPSKAPPAINKDVCVFTSKTFGLGVFFRFTVEHLQLLPSKV